MIQHLWHWTVHAATAAAAVGATLLIQSTFLIAAGLLAAACLRRRSALVRSTILRATLVAVIGCPLAACMLARSGADRYSIALPAINGYALLTALAALVAALLLVRLALAIRIVSGIRHSARSASLNWIEDAGRCARTFGVATPSVLQTDRFTTPCLVGFQTPVILLPAAAQTVRHDVLVHELAHLRRRDCLWHLFCHIARALLWFQPLMWLLTRRIEQSADEVCDDFVVAYGGDRAEYARALVDIAERHQMPWIGRACAVGMASLKSTVSRRVVRIMDNTRTITIDSRRLTLLLILTLGLSATLLTAMLAATISPALADNPSAPAPAPAAAPAAAAPPRLAVPDPAAQAKKEKLIRDVFGNFNTAPLAERPAIAAKLLDQGMATADDPTARYVLLKDGGDLAASVGDAATAMRAATLLASIYAVDPGDLKLALLRKAATAATTPVVASAVAQEGLNCASEAVASGNYDLASRFMSSTEQAARTAKDVTLILSVQSRAADIKWLQSESLHAKTAEEKLNKTPTDPDANHTLGRYFCLVRGDWTRGLIGLSKGSNPAYHAAAAADLANPTTTDKQVAAGDLWWDIAEKETAGAAQRALRRRAGYWYSQALANPQFAGLSRALVEKRQGQIPPAGPGEVVAEVPPAGQPAAVPPRAIPSPAPGPVVSNEPPPRAPAASAEMIAFARQRSAMPPDKQMPATLARLKELNGGADIKANLTVKNGEVRLDMPQQNALVNIEPLYGMRVTNLNLGGCEKLRSLNGIQGMPLTELSLANCFAIEGDLSILAGMRLTTLQLGGCRKLRSLNGLQGMPLAGELNLSNSWDLDGDLSPLLGMKLTEVYLGSCNKLKSLNGLQGMPLTGELNLVNCWALEDISALRGMKLAHIVLAECNKLRSLDALAGMPLTSELNLKHCYALDGDLSALRGMQLTSLNLTECKNLKSLNGTQGMPLKELVVPKHLAQGNVALILEAFPALEILKTNDARIDDDAAAAIKSRKGLPPAAYKPPAGGNIFTDTPPNAVANTLGMKFVRIEPGEFMMGSPPTEVGRSDSETLHHVKITKPFLIATTTVTQAQWKVLMGNNPSRFQGGNRPVEQVSWNEAVAFCEKLSQKEGKHYRLPTEAEWEYACRAGTQTPFSFGDGRVDDFAWYGANSGEQTHPVATKKPNGWGLYDMQGNVRQWCADGYGPYNGNAIDPKGGDDTSPRVLRGAPWLEDVRECRAAFRHKKDPGGRSDGVGFRVCLDVTQRSEGAPAVAGPPNPAAPAPPPAYTPPAGGNIFADGPPPAISKNAQAFAMARNALPADKQIATTLAQLKEANGGHEIKLEIQPNADGTLRMHIVNQRDLVSIEPLYGLRVTNLTFYGCPNLSSLSGIQGMPLTELSLQDCRSLQGDLSLLKGMRLTRLDLTGCQGLRSLNGIQGMPLTEFSITYCSGLQGDLSVLKGMRLTYLNLASCQGLSTLNGIQGMALTGELSLAYCSGLEGDLSALAGMALTKVPLQTCQKLKSLNGLQGMALTELDLTHCHALENLLPLKGMRLTKVLLQHCGKLKDLSGLEGAPLKELELPKQLAHASPKAVLDAFPALESVKTGDEKTDNDFAAEIARRKALGAAAPGPTPTPNPPAAGNIFTDGPNPQAGVTGGARTGKRNILLFEGGAKEEALFRAVPGANLRVVKMADAAGVLARPDAIGEANIVVWGCNTFNHVTEAVWTPAVWESMRRQMEAGGDVIIFGQVGGNAVNGALIKAHWDFIEKNFGATIRGGPIGATAAKDELAVHFRAAGLSDELLASVAFSKAFVLPANATVLVKGGKAHDVPVVAVIPVGKGRLILDGGNFDNACEPFEKALFEYIYGANAGGAHPPGAEANPAPAFPGAASAPAKPPGSGINGSIFGDTEIKKP